MPRQSIISKVRDELQTKGYAIKSQQSRDWMRKQFRSVTMQPAMLKESGYEQKGNVKHGRMYFYHYDPKFKHVLPFYDRFPLTIILERYNDGFLGLNLHYFPPKYRIALLDRLYMFTNNNKFDESTRFKMTYRMLNSIKKTRVAKPCVKRYLYAHMRSKFIEIPSRDWELATYLPVEQFKKVKKSVIYKNTPW